MGISPSSLHDLESGRTKWTRKLLGKFIEAMDV